VVDRCHPYRAAAVTVIPVPGVGVEARPRTALRLRVTSRVRLAAAATTVCALFVGALVHLDARADLQAERATLEQARLERATAVACVDSVRSALRTRTDQRDGLKSQLQAASDELNGVRSTLGTAFAALGLQGAQIEALDECLNGVSRALLQLAFEDDAGAARSLRAVAGRCDAASVAIDAPGGGR
jgi:gamma-glutamyl:cysteine ligase YbdK (ATP-grasp superfamily)